MRPAAELLLIEADAIRPLLGSLDASQFDLPTVCTGWSVRDVRSHCAAALEMVGRARIFGVSGEAIGSLTTDLETFVRLCGGRRPDSDRYQLSDVPAPRHALFS